jgi:rRNA biogenesis protein RRP5
LSIDIAKRRLSLGLKPSYFAGDQEEISGNAELEPDTFDVVNEDKDDDVGLANDDIVAINNEDADSTHADVDMQNANGHRSVITVGSSTPAPPSALKLQGGFQWFVTHTPSDEDVGSYSSSDESQGEQSKHKKKPRKQIEKDLTADMHTKTPESNADFERILLGSPNSSYLWIQYMSFQLQLSEIDKAREIARHALQTINFREEQEKLNVWIASLNLENVYGSDETLEATFKQAARHNDSKTVHLRLAFIFDQTQKYTVRGSLTLNITCISTLPFQKAEEQYKRTCKKFGHSSKVWTLFGEHYLQRGDTEQARKLLPRSLQSLDKRKRNQLLS